MNSSLLLLLLLLVLLPCQRRPALFIVPFLFFGAKKHEGSVETKSETNGKRERETGRKRDESSSSSYAHSSVNRRPAAFFLPLPLSYAPPYSNEAIPRFSPTSESANLFLFASLPFYSINTRRVLHTPAREKEPVPRLFRCFHYIYPSLGTRNIFVPLS